MNLRNVVGMVALSAALVFSGCTTMPGEGGDTIKIGWVGPLSGNLSSLGQDSLVATELAIEEINAAGGVNGKQLELLAQDGKCANKEASLAAHKLINLSQVTAVLAQCSPEMLAIAPIAEENQVILMGSVSSAPAITEAGDYVFRSYPSDTLQGKFAAEYAYNKLEKRSAVLLVEQNDWGVGLSQTFQDNFKELGGEVLFAEQFEPSNRDFRGQLTRIKESGADFLYMPAFTESSIAALKQANELGLEMDIMGGDAWTDTKVHESGFADGIYYSAGKTAPTEDFVAKLAARDTDPTVITPTSYDNVRILAQLMNAGAMTGPELKDALYAMEPFQGVNGPISFDENGDVVEASFEVFQITGSTATPLE